MMRLTVRKQIGQQAYNFSFEGENFFDVVLASQELGFRDVLQCGLCNSKSLYLRAYRTEKEKYEYVKICCFNPDCRAQVTFGKAKKDGAFYLRKTEDGKKIAWEKFENGKAAEEPGVGEI